MTKSVTRAFSGIVTHAGGEIVLDNGKDMLGLEPIVDDFDTKLGEELLAKPIVEGKVYEIGEGDFFWKADAAAILNRV